MNRLMLFYEGSPAARKFTLRMGFVLVLAATLTGCAVGPKYQRPTVKLQPFHNAPSIEARTSSLPAPPIDQWWTGFRDPELTRIVKRALDQNLDLAAAMAKLFLSMRAVPRHSPVILCKSRVQFIFLPKNWPMA